MSGAMPKSARYEIRDADGALLVTVPARISGGGVSAELPTFPPGTFGRVELVTVDVDGTEYRDGAELEELPTKPVTALVQMG